MVFMDYRGFIEQEVPFLEAENPTFLYAMPVTSTRVFFEVCTILFHGFNKMGSEKFYLFVLV